MVMFPRSRRRRFRFSKLRLSLDSFTLSRLLKIAFIGIVAGIFFTFALFVWYSRELPTPGKLVVSKYGDATRIYDRNNKLLYSVYQDQNRSYVALKNIPKKAQEATIAIEDQDFYKNQGFSIFGYIRVVWNALLGKGLAGASTISQQLVKNVLLTNERSLPRKIKELILAIQINQRFSKDEILEMYLNNIPYGGTAIGIEAASETYFGKKAKDLDIAESAFLAGLPQSPSSYSPFTGNKLYIGRTQAVLRQMAKNDYITQKESDAAIRKIEQYKFTQKTAGIKAPHFVIYVKNELAKEFGEHYVETGGLQVTTTLDYDLQEKAEEILKDELDKLKGYKVGNGAAMITDPKTGKILAMVGSKDYNDEDNDGNFNAAVDGKRQPGSSLKPIIYAKAFEKGYSPATLVMDVKTDFPTDDPTLPIYTPVNYSEKFSGPMQLRFALGNSINIPAVKMLALVGIKDAMQKAYDMGITNWEPTAENKKNVGLSLVLGGRETTLFDEMTAYGVFANEGVRQDLVAIKKVTDVKGKKLFENKFREGSRVLSEEVSYLISQILQDNGARAQEFGVNSYLRILGKTVSVKTGTTDLKRDNWTVGYTPSYVVGVWVGNNDNTPMNPKIASGVTGASSIWHSLMSVVLKNKKDEQFTKPDNIIALQIDSFSGGLPVDGQGMRSEYFVKGTEPTARSLMYRNRDGKDYIVFQESDPVSTDGTNRWQQGIDAWIEQNHKGNDKYNPPDEVKNPKKPDQPTSTPQSLDSTPTPSPVSDPTPTSDPVATLTPTP